MRLVTGDIAHVNVKVQHRHLMGHSWPHRWPFRACFGAGGAGGSRVVINSIYVNPGGGSSMRTLQYIEALEKAPEALSFAKPSFVPPKLPALTC